MGSVTKGTERFDSDLDAMVDVNEKYYQKRVKNNSTSETFNEMCTYEIGYFDIKYITKDFLEMAAKKGSEPTRSSFFL